MELGRRDPADVPEALHDATLLGQVPAQPPTGALDHHHDTRAGRLVTEHGAADRDRLAGHDLRHGVPALHRVRVHHPRHRLLVRRHVRRRNVLLRPDEAHQLGREAARDARQLVLGELARIAADAALRAAVRQPQQRAFPGHPHGKGSALAQVDGVVVADAALRRAEHRGMPDPVRRERAVRAVVHLDRNGHDQRPLGRAETVGDEIRDARVFERVIELGQRLAVEGRVPLETQNGLCDLGHAVKLAPDPESRVRSDGRRRPTGTRRERTRRA